MIILKIPSSRFFLLFVVDFIILPLSYYLTNEDPALPFARPPVVPLYLTARLQINDGMAAATLGVGLEVNLLY